ncbi:MAG: SurA N-terminal domain-containing protein, partial [bacterium]|nr:SurA N-terminal domain-containing protein [bacterium]
MENRKEMNQEKVSSVKNVVSFVKKVNFFQILILLVLVLVGFFAYKYKGEFIVATVNGKPITRIELMKELEKQGAKQALDSIIVQRLIAEKAKNENIEISNEDVAAEIKNIKEMLTAQGL